MSRRLLRMVWAVALMALLALGARKPKNDDGPAAQLSKAPASARSLQSPFRGQDQEAAAAGRKLYQQHCAGCHGTDARGIAPAADLRSPTIQSARPGVLFWALRNGRIRRGMPSWSRLPDQQIWQIVAYLETLK